MKASRLEISIEKGAGELVVLLLSGIFYKEGLSALREMMQRLVEDGYRRIVIEMQEIELRDMEIREGFIEIFNDMKGRGGQIALLTQREEVLNFFSSIRNLIDIYPSLDEYRHSGLFESLRRQGIVYSKKTGIRLSLQMSLLLLVLVMGWLITLALFLFSQSGRLDRQQELIAHLETERLDLERELAALQQKLAPLTQLGLTSDSLMAADYQFTSDWIDHLEDRFRKKQIADSLEAIAALEADSSQAPVEATVQQSRKRKKR